MQIYIGNLSAAVNRLDLAQFLRGFGTNLSFTFKYYQHDGKRFYYALTSITPDSQAKRAIARRHMTRLNGRSTVLRPFINRASINERRALDWRDKKWESEECRKIDRRHEQFDKNAHKVMQHLEAAPNQSQSW